MDPSPKTPKNILIVDDEMDMRIFMKTLFETGGYRAIVARDGREGMRKAVEHLPDLIILDVMMPGEGGVAMYQHLKKEPRLAKVPVIMLTGVGAETFGHFLAMLQSQSPEPVPAPDDYIEKPPEPQQLLKIAESLLYGKKNTSG